jgi:hypothetical protein
MERADVIKLDMERNGLRQKDIADLQGSAFGSLFHAFLTWA